MTKKWVEVNDLSSGQYSINKSDAYIVVEWIISVTGTKANNRIIKKLTFKNNPPFRSCISKINNTFIDNAEDLDTVMPMYNLLEYSDNYSMTPESLCNYYRDEIYDDEKVNDSNNNRLNSNKTITSKSFKYKTKNNREDTR